MRFSTYVAVTALAAFCPGCAGCGHDKVIIKDNVTTAAPSARRKLPRRDANADRLAGCARALARWLTPGQRAETAGPRGASLCLSAPISSDAAAGEGTRPSSSAR